MLGDGGKSVVESVEGFQFLGLHEALYRLHSFFLKSLAMRFLQKDELLVYAALISGRSSTQGIGSAGPWPVQINRAARLVYKHAAGFAVIHHGQVEAGEGVFW